MNNVMRKLALGSLMALAAAAASAAEVTVNYIDSDKFSDLPSGGERGEAMRGIAAHFEKLAAKLPAAYKLRIDVQDVDMAGSEQPSGARTDMRVTTRGEWPRINLRYALENNGQVVSEADAELRDTAFLDRPNRYMPSDIVRYEKRMIDNWFEKTLVPLASR